MFAEFKENKFAVKRMQFNLDKIRQIHHYRPRKKKL